MDEKKNYFQEKSKSINGIIEQNESTLLKSKLIIIFDFIKKEQISNMTLLDLKKKINIKFNIHEYEYEILINEIPITNLSNEILILSLLNKYNTNKITIKTFKSIFDIKNQLNNYEKLLTKNISLKDNEINLLNIEYDNIKKDLQNI